ncbi:MAG: hypothetical protein Q8R29_00190 [bacterium]|nr:hypothetical protein [bacterium]
MYQVKIPLPKGIFKALLMDAVTQRDSIYPGKSYATYPPGGETPKKLATELSAVWHGHATAMDGIRLLSGGDLPNAIGDVIGTYYLVYILRLVLEETTDFSRPNTDAYRLGTTRQSWLANSGDRDALKQRLYADWEKMSNFTPDYLSFWQKYYDIFGGRREGDLKFLNECGFDAIWRWLWIFTAANPSCGIIISLLHTDVVLIK